MRFISALWILFYFSSSLVCGGMKQSCCNQKTDSVGHKSCHSQAPGQPAKNAFDLCCCKISADIPKTNLDILSKNAFSLSSFYFSTDMSVSSRDVSLFFRYLHTFLGPPGLTLQQHFSDAVFSALAPPLSL
jgi:hypothetical protein